MDYGQISLQKHTEWKGKIEVTARAAVDSAEALSIAYTPGVAAPCLEIQKDPEKSYTAHKKVEHGSGRDRWHSSSGTWRYRPGGGHARHGGQMCSL